MPLTEADITLVCVSNEVGGTYNGNAEWLGVPLAGARSAWPGCGQAPTRCCPPPPTG